MRTKQRTYRCDNGHEINAPTPPERCPVYVLGVPCDAAVRPVGRR